MSRAIGRAVERVWEPIARVGRAITAPVERASGRAFGVVRHFERVEDWLGAFGRAALWPVRMLGRMLLWLIMAAVPTGVRARVGRGFAGWLEWRRRAGEAAWSLVERLNLDAPFRWLAWLLQPLWRPLWAVGGFLYAWAATRPYRRMAWATPALVLLVPVLGAVIWGLTWGRESVATQYRVAVEDAREDKDFPRMQLMERKLEQLGVDNDHSDFEAALRLAKEGKYDEAYERMLLLAPAETLGYPAAHNWIIINLLQDKLDVPEDQRLKLAEAHLKHLTTLGIKGPEIDLLTAVSMAQGGRLEEAADILEPLINRMELAALQRFEIDVLLNRLDEARRDAHALKLHFEQAQRDAERFDSERYKIWAQCEELLGNTADLARVVRAWIKVDPQNATARASVAKLDLQEFSAILQSPLPNAEELAERLSEAMGLLDDTTKLEPEIQRLWSKRHEQPALIRMFEILIAAADTPPALVGAIGTVAAMSGDMPLARQLLERAAEAEPDVAVVWNNYAWALSQPPDPEYERALEAVNRSLELAPKEFRFRETRGQILVALARWEEAVEDLEFALNGMPDSDAIHNSLATAYDHLGQAELATIHRQQAE